MIPLIKEYDKNVCSFGHYENDDYDYDVDQAMMNLIMMIVKKTMLRIMTKMIT